jgi:Mg2+ and Co2+ transporter CorA
MTLHNKKFINMDVNTNGTWWVDYLDTSLEHPRIIREVFDTENDARQFYDDLIS